MQDLNDLRLFAAVVDHGGFSAAARVLGMPKSRLSKRVARLEEQLGVRLLERSTRSVRMTDIGERFHEQCEAVLAGVEAAEAIVAVARAQPCGIIRASCPPGLVPGLVADILPGFLQAYPQVRVELTVSNRAMDLVEDRIDVALRVRAALDTDPNLTLRKLGTSRMLLMASPGFAAANRERLTIERLAELPTLTPFEGVHGRSWELQGPDGRVAAVAHEPRLASPDFEVLRAAAVAGLGVVLLSEHMCNCAIGAGALVRVLPEWSTRYGTVHLVFATRRGLLPAVRAFIDHLARELPAVIAERA